jgi:hypothetical protein
MTDHTPRHKLGIVAYAVAFALLFAGLALYQLVLRQYVPALMLGESSYDFGKGLGAALFGALFGGVGWLLGFTVERRVRGKRPRAINR